jgi:hypothetical protein
MPTKKPIIMPGLNGGPSLESSSRLPQAPEAKGKGPKKIIVPPLNFVTIELKIVGVTSLICNRFQKKMADHLPDAETPRPDSPMASVPRKQKRGSARPVRNLDDDVLESLYPLPEGGYGFPAIAFKRAIVGACRQIGELDMKLANRIIFVHSTHEVIIDGFTTQCIKINGTPRLRKDIGRNSGMTRSPRTCCRGEFMPWGATLRIEFNANMLTHEGVFHLVQYGGKCEGVGEQRPSALFASGNNGQFRLVDSVD